MECTNMERMKESVPDAGDQGLQYFISDNSWEEVPVLDERYLMRSWWKSTK